MLFLSRFFFASPDNLPENYWNQLTFCFHTLAAETGLRSQEEILSGCSHGASLHLILFCCIRYINQQFGWCTVQLNSKKENTLQMDDAGWVTWFSHPFQHPALFAMCLVLFEMGTKIIEALILQCVSADHASFCLKLDLKGVSWILWKVNFFKGNRANQRTCKMTGEMNGGIDPVSCENG